MSFRARREAADDPRWQTLNEPVLCDCGEVCELQKMPSCYACRTEPMCRDCYTVHMEERHS